MPHSKYLAPASLFFFLTSSYGAATDVPSQAQLVIKKVHHAAKAKDFLALEKLMVKEFIWSFGGDGDAKQAIESWKANPQTIRELERVTASRCETRRDGSVECPPNARFGYRARFMQADDGWHMASFVAGD